MKALDAVIWSNDRGANGWGFVIGVPMDLMLNICWGVAPYDRSVKHHMYAVNKVLLIGNADCSRLDCPNWRGPAWRGQESWLAPASRPQVLHASSPREPCGLAPARSWPALKSRCRPMRSVPSRTTSAAFEPGAWIGRAGRWASDSRLFGITNRSLINCYEPALPSRLCYIDDKLGGGLLKVLRNGRRCTSPTRVVRRSARREVLWRVACDHDHQGARCESKTGC